MIFHYFFIFIIVTVDTDIIDENFKPALGKKIETEERHKSLLMVSITKVYRMSKQAPFQNADGVGRREYKLYVIYTSSSTVPFFSSPPFVFNKYLYSKKLIYIYRSSYSFSFTIFYSQTLDRSALEPYLPLKLLGKGKLERREEEIHPEQHQRVHPK